MMEQRKTSAASNNPRVVSRSNDVAGVRGESVAQKGTDALFAEGVAHELNNLLATILGNAALACNQLDKGHPSAANLETISKTAERAAELARRILAFAHGDRPEGEPVNLDTIVYHVLLTEEQHLAPRIRIVRYINPDLWKVAASHAEIAQVALELATNAVDSILDKGRVYIGTRNVDLTREAAPLGSNLKSARYVLLSVEDNGCGMDAETRSRIFEPGFTTKPGRRGMGLANVQNVVSDSGGYISVSTIKGHGTVFRIYFPAFQEGKEKASSVAQDLPGGTETILIVDDERMIVDVTQETLERLGYHTLVAHNGAEAVEVARTHDGPIHLAVLDMVMPVMGGVEAFPLLREARPDMRVIVCTGLDQEIISHEILEDESSGFLLKPFRPSTLAQEVRKALDIKESAPKKGASTLR